ncbi:MAG TPA: hypothetical protein VJT31_14460 [Rugosimonospora sp.]|nr:hypothetical protein [Rugosimonospora sp.]
MTRQYPQRRRLLVVWPVVLAATGILAPALAAPSGAFAATPSMAIAQAQARLSVRPQSVRPGGRILITGFIPTSGAQSCLAGDAAIPTSTAALFPPDGFGPPAPRSNTGRFEIRYVVPTSTPPGTYRIGVRCGGGNVGVSATLRVV